MKIKLGCFLIIVLNFGTVLAEELRFNELGQMLAPDQTYLEQGMDSQGRGHMNDAMRYFKKSARFGNSYAQSAIAFMHMQNNDYLNALAWFKLVDLKMIDKDQLILDLVTELESAVNNEQQLSLVDISNQLEDTYGKQAALDHREAWLKSLSFGGSKIKGHIPGRVKIYSSGRIEQKAFGESEIFVSSSFVTGEAVRLQMKEFIYDYEYKFTRGKVSMPDIELIEEEKQI